MGNLAPMKTVYESCCLKQEKNTIEWIWKMLKKHENRNKNLQTRKVVLVFRPSFSKLKVTKEPVLNNSTEEKNWRLHSNTHL